jgi:hypothetical protein
MAFPGWRAIAEKTATLPADVQDPAGAYDEGTIRNLLSDLNRWGYLPSVWRGPEGGGRAIAHYTIAEPPYDKLRDEITKFIMNGRDRRARDPEERKRLDALATSQSDIRKSNVTTPSDISGASDVTRDGDISSDVTRGRAADVTRGHVTVTCKEEPEEKRPSGASAPGVRASLFPDEALSGGVPPPSPKRRRRTLGSGGATEEQWLRFWPAYPIKDGKFKAHRNFLELTHAEAELAIFAAGQYSAKVAAQRERLARRGEKPAIKHAQGWLSERRFEDDDYVQGYAATLAGPLDPDEEVKRHIASPDGQALSREKGLDEAMRIILDIVLGRFT